MKLRYELSRIDYIVHETEESVNPIIPEAM